MSLIELLRAGLEIIYKRLGSWALLIGLLLPLAARAQSGLAVRGTVADGRNAPLELATVTLHRAADSVVVKTEFSDATGKFLLQSPAAGRYRVSVAQVGYARYWSAPLDLGLGDAPAPAPLLIVLQASAATALQEVTVTARKPLYEPSPRGTLVNVADNPLSAGATTLDVLGRSPGVTLDAGSNLALRGRQGLLVVIDGRRTPLAGAELADYLRALPADQIQSLELLTNPPAQYDAQGGAGVIVINLKKDQRLGTNGSANASYGQGRYGKLAAGLSLNSRGKKYNLYGNYAYADRRNFTDIDFARTFTEQLLRRPAASSVLSTDQVLHLRSHTAKVGLDLNLSKRTLLGAAVSGLVSQVNSHTDNQTQLLYGTSSEHFSSFNDLSTWRPSLTANLNFKHSFADSATARSLSADADVARYHTARRNDLTTYFDAPSQAASLLHGDQGSTLIIRAAKLDYAQPLPHRLRLEAGAKATLVTSDNNVTFITTQQGVSAVDTAISKPFYYRENVNAAYATLRGTLAGTSFQAGLRAEQTNLRADQGPRPLREQHYLQLFPNLLLERALNKNNSLTLAVARRVERPSYLQLNPLRAYLDATSYAAGNPYLVAETTTNVELTHRYKNTLSTALAYARSSQPIVNVIQPAPDGGYLVVSQPANLSTRDFYTLALTAPLMPRPWWNLYANVLGYYNHYTGTLAGTALDRGGFGAELTLNNSFTLPHGWAAELNGSYESRQVYNYQNISDRGQVSVGVQKSMWQKQGTLRLSVTDIFYTQPYQVISTYDTFNERYYTRQDTRVATLSLSYRFGNSKVAAARKRAAGAEDELRRAAAGQ
ncbi:outer membrane beta-barrel protein [Hymenobacter sp. RP-2-7]|uniref:Outer membrane beta-barrel protein n=1 Tax=Hymenobacter polaris TaxID=2682546 RepID=A0A7Y0AHH6_9BACT|nr:TonB-dependent receptor [Hymenobacter polaris]NML67474.1 outer membrane beta-barrel protein [Hymenobacter polaris]